MFSQSWCSDEARHTAKQINLVIKKKAIRRKIRQDGRWKMIVSW